MIYLPTLMQLTDNFIIEGFYITLLCYTCGRQWIVISNDMASNLKMFLYTLYKNTPRIKKQISSTRLIILELPCSSQETKHSLSVFVITMILDNLT